MPRSGAAVSVAVALAVVALILSPVQATGAERSSGPSGPSIAAESHSRAPEAEQQQSESIFSGSLANAVWTLVIFVVLLIVLRATAWKPILKSLQDREQTIRSAIEEAEHARDNAEKLLEKYRKQLQDAQAEAERIIGEGRNAAVSLKEQITSAARQEAQQIKQKALSEIELARDQALKEIYLQTAEIATQIASQIIERQLSPDDHRQLVDKALAEIREHAVPSSA